MEENCYAEPIYKAAVSAQQLQQADRATLAIWGMGCQNCVTRVWNASWQRREYTGSTSI